MPAAFLAVLQLHYVAFSIGDGAVLSTIHAVAKLNIDRSLDGNGKRTVHPSVLCIVETSRADGEVCCGVVEICGTVSAVFGNLYAELCYAGVEDISVSQLNGEVAPFCCTDHTTEHSEDAQ